MLVRRHACSSHGVLAARVPPTGAPRCGHSPDDVVDGILLFLKKRRNLLFGKNPVFLLTQNANFALRNAEFCMEMLSFGWENA